MSEHSIYQDGTYLQHNPNWHQEHSPWKARQVLELLRRNKLQPASVAEIGCGAGGVLESLARETGGSARYHGFDISPQAYALCSKKQTQNLQFTLGDLLTAGLPPFDVSMAIDVFEHVEDCYSFLRRFRATGNYKVFHIPLDLSVQTVLRASPLASIRATLGHVHYYTKEMALAVLQETGYEVLDWFYTQGSIQFQTSWKAGLLRAPRRILFAMNQDFAVRLLGGYSMMVLAR
jgi:SAM-dependent methyltransferase